MLSHKLLAMPARVLLFRHGESLQNLWASTKPAGAPALRLAHGLFGSTVSKPLLLVSNRLLGRPTTLPITDCQVPLTEEGEHQAILTGLRLVELGIEPDVILTSTFYRAILSGAFANCGMVKAGGQAAPLSAHEFLVERQEGRLDGIPRSYLPILEPGEARLYFEHSESGRLHLYRPPGGESMLDVYRRVADNLPALLAQFPGQTVIIFGHGVTNMCIRAFLLQEDIVAAVNARAYRMPNLALMDFRWQPQRWNLIPETSGKQIFQLM
jgi:broad specificity phosphatase PhoE